MTYRFLHLEDDPLDAELVAATLAAEHCDCEIRHVRDGPSFHEALADGRYDLIMADHSVPGYDGLLALEEARRTRPAIPFIMVSGTFEEEMAILSLGLGLTDYVSKRRLSRLGPAVRRALEEVRERRSRSEAEAALHESHRFIERVLRATPDMVLVWSPESREISWAAGQVESILGMGVEDLTKADARLIQEAAHPGDAETIRVFAERLMTLEDGEHAEVEFRSRHADGRYRWLASRGVVFSRHADGRPARLLSVIHDVTERREAETRLLRAQRMESIGTLAGGIAHDLNNVLAPILMAGEILERRLEEPGARRLATTIAESARRGAGLVQQILGFARGVDGERAPIEPREQIEEVARLLAQTLPRSIELRVVPPGPLDQLLGDRTQIQQVLLNLCVNARDAMPAGGVLTIGAESADVDESFARRHLDARPGRYVCFFVSDTGEGMSRETVEWIFDPFFTTKPQGQGTGLGLSTSLGIVRSHGGFFSVYSEPARGSSFRVYLPAAGDGAREAAGEAEAGLLGQGELILVVDDEETILSLAREALEANGYTVLTARNETEALACCHGSPVAPAAVVTDVHMPGLGGGSVVRTLRECSPALKVLVTSGLPPDEAEASLPYLGKPYAAAELLRAVRRLLDANEGDRP